MILVMGETVVTTSSFAEGAAGGTAALPQAPASSATKTNSGNRKRPSFKTETPRTSAKVNVEGRCRGVQLNAPTRPARGLTFARLAAIAAQPEQRQVIGLDRKPVFTLDLVKERLNRAMFQRLLPAAAQAHQVVMGRFTGQLVYRLAPDIGRHHQALLA